ncbi:hypothetical protein ElyMa_006593500 [Elysia marginata]|uniref:Uncharacterized protein n=1 Tax=Elysia marginata TaxID=1093978 RepID=A0AAV4II73_9GAST|nr:hypothetical protein ElyMa_006593500 [Elysia marginata]
MPFWKSASAKTCNNLANVLKEPEKTGVQKMHKILAANIQCRSSEVVKSERGARPESVPKKGTCEQLLQLILQELKTFSKHLCFWVAIQPAASDLLIGQVGHCCVRPLRTPCANTKMRSEAPIAAITRLLCTFSNTDAAITSVEKLSQTIGSCLMIFYMTLIS